MISEITIPIMDQATEAVTLTGWLKKEGDPVGKGEAVCEIETEKAAVQIEANISGVLRKMLIRAGARIPPLTVVGLIAEANEPLPDIDPYYRTTQAGEAAAVSRSPPGEVAPSLKAGVPGRKIFASPRARRLADEHRVDLSTVAGTGPGGRILEEDVRQAIAQLPSPAPAAARFAKARADRVSQSWRAIPHFYTAITVDLFRVEARKSSAGSQITYTDYFALAIAHALAEHPQLNGHWLNEALVLIPEVRLGIVVQTEHGLMIPTLRDLVAHSLESIALERERLVQQAHAGRLGAEAMAAPTFTLSNIGAGHIDHFTAIISPPQVAILSVGSIQPRPLVVGAELGIRPAAIFTLGVDHRAIDGRQAAAFLERLKADLESEG